MISFDELTDALTPVMSEIAVANVLRESADASTATAFRVTAPVLVLVTLR